MIMPSTSKHFAILQGTESFEFKIPFPDLKYVFSAKRILQLVEEETKRDTSVFIDTFGQSLQSMSSGERKRALFTYLLSQEYDYLIVENLFENLDAINKSHLKQQLLKASEKIRIIQIVRKEEDVFPFIDDFFTVNFSQSLEPYLDTVQTFFRNRNDFFSNFSIPSTTTSYNYDYRSFVNLKDVSIKFYEKQVLKNISWEIKLGEFWQLIGENGSGKTTLLSLITGDSHKAYGQDIVLFDKLKGTEENVWEIKQKIGYFTSTITELFNKRHSVIHMVLSGFYDSVGLYVKPLDIHVKLAQEWIALLGMTSIQNKTFTTLSLAEQRMVLIARAMVKHPPLLILDEPTAGLNTESAKLITALISKISKETQTTIIYVSHTTEKGISPDKIYQLTKTEDGSVGSVLA